MRRTLFVSSLASAALFLLVASACTTEIITEIIPAKDAGKDRSASSGDEESPEPDIVPAQRDGGTFRPTLPSDPLAPGLVQLLGLIGDDAIYYAAETTSLHAVPVAGGAAVKIADRAPTDRFLVRGGVLALWTDVVGPVGTLNVWTSASGLKAVAANTVVGSVRATADGTRIAFLQNPTVLRGSDGGPSAISDAEIGVRDVAGGANLATFTLSSQRVSLAFGAACRPQWDFVGKLFLTAHCSASQLDATAAKLFAVSTGAIVRVDASTAGSAPTVQPFWAADGVGAKVMVLSPGGSAKFITVATKETTGATGDEVVRGEAIVLADGSAAVYRTAAGAIKKATTAALPSVKTIVATDVKALLGVSADESRLVYRLTDPAEGSVFSDLHVVDHTVSKPVPVDVSTASIFAGFSADSTHLFYLEKGVLAGDVSSLPVLGGAPLKLAGGAVSARPVPEGAGVVLLTNAFSQGTAPNTTTFVELHHIDGAAGGGLDAISDAVPSTDIRFKGKRLVYARRSATGAGLYAITLP